MISATDIVSLNERVPRAKRPPARARPPSPRRGKALRSGRKRTKRRSTSEPAVRVAPALTLAFLQQTVEAFYTPLFKFAHRLCGNSTDAADFTQETFYLAQTRGHQLQTPGKVKSWLFTTLYREFLKRRQRQNRFPEVALEDAEDDLPRSDSTHAVRADASLALRTLGAMDERYRLPLKLFYLENKSYREIAAAVPLPIGTVMSRISRGKRLLASALAR